MCTGPRACGRVGMHFMNAAPWPSGQQFTALTVANAIVRNLPASSLPPPLLCRPSGAPPHATCPPRCGKPCAKHPSRCCAAAGDDDDDGDEPGASRPLGLEEVLGSDGAGRAPGGRAEQPGPPQPCGLPPAVLNRSLPNVLLVGDSVSDTGWGYGPAVRQMLERPRPRLTDGGGGGAAIEDATGPLAAVQVQQKCFTALRRRRLHHECVCVCAHALRRWRCLDHECCAWPRLRRRLIDQWCAAFRRVGRAAGGERAGRAEQQRRRVRQGLGRPRRLGCHHPQLRPARSALRPPPVLTVPTTFSLSCLR